MVLGRVIDRLRGLRDVYMKGPGRDDFIIVMLSYIISDNLPSPWLNLSSSLSLNYRRLYVSKYVPENGDELYYCSLSMHFRSFLGAWSSIDSW